jgi:ribonuclease D
VAQEVAAWREWRARETDQPARFVLPELAVQAIAHGQPATVAALRQIRGLDGRHLRGSISADLLAAINRGQALPEGALLLPPAEEVDREMRPAVALAAAWVAQLARDWHIDAALLATRSDLVSYLRGEETSRLADGWRGALLGQPLGKLIRGEAALAFNGRGRLVLEARSHRPVDPSG